MTGKHDYKKGVDTRDPTSHRTPTQIQKMDHGYNRTHVKQREERNQARALLMKQGRVKVGDHRDVNHIRMVKNGGTNQISNLNVETQHKNRGWERDARSRAK